MHQYNNLQKRSELKMNRLTDREIEVMNLVTSGYDNQEIAKKLRISRNATEACVSNIYRKLDEKNKNSQKNKT